MVDWWLWFSRKNKIRKPLKKVKHSVVTVDYIAIEKIQSQNWQYFVESVLEACRRKNSGETVYQHQSKLIKAIIENVTIAKKTYKSFYKQITDNLTFMLDNLPDDEFKEIINDLHTENYLPDNFDNFLDCWCEFYFHKGRFPGSQELIMVPQAQIPPFIKAQMPLSPIDLYQNFKATDARALVSIQALAALNIYLGGDKTISKNALSEFLHNLSFQALSKKADDIYLNFNNVSELIIDILEGLAKKNNESIAVAKNLGKNLQDELDQTDFELELPPELQIQDDLEKYAKQEKIPPPPPPRFTSTPLKSKKEINKTYDDSKEEYLKTAITINKTDLDAAIENTDDKNKKIVSDIIDPMPGLFVDDKLNLENQFEYKSNDIEKNLNSSNNLQDRLDNILLLMKEKQPPIEKNNTKKWIELIPNNPFLNYEKIDEEIETEDIYIDNSYTDNYSNFLLVSTDDRKDFKIKINGGDLIAFKYPSLTTVDNSKTQLKVLLNNFLEDLNANRKYFTDHLNKRRDLKRILKT